MRSADLALILTGVALNAVAQLLLKAGSRVVGTMTFDVAGTFSLFERLIGNPPILGGMLCYAVSMVVWIFVLSKVDVSLAYPMLSIGYVVNALGAWALFSEQLSVSRLTGIAVIIAGVWLVARS